MTDQPKIQWSEEQFDLLNFLHNSKESCFITGEAGAGKSTVVNHYIETLRELQSKHQHADLMSEPVVVLAPTGIAALNVGGSTLHSFFGLPPQFVSPWEAADYLRGSTVDKIQGLKALLIDEISMVRADIFATIDRMMQLARSNPNPFGGVRIILVGDVMQLPPVVTSKEEKEQMAALGSRSGWFFKTEAFKKLNPRVFNLSQSFRQNDPKFIALLNRVRAGDRKVPWDLNAAVKRVSEASDNVIQLSCTNADVDQLNERRLEALDGEKGTYQGTIIDKFNEKQLPVPKMLNLGVGARVMTLKNARGYVNGQLGTLVAMQDNSVDVQLDRGGLVNVCEAEWQNIKYQSHGGALVKVVEGTYRQLPIRLAYAITVHRSQGATIDGAIIDFGTRVFAHGQAYVALSRLRSLENMYFVRNMKPADIIIDPEVAEFLAEHKKPTKTAAKPAVASEKRPRIE